MNLIHIDFDNLTEEQAIIYKQGAKDVLYDLFNMSIKGASEGLMQKYKDMPWEGCENDEDYGWAKCYEAFDEIACNIEEYLD